MDPKASAKAKRSHTLHGRRTHAPPPPNAQKKKPQAQGKEPLKGGEQQRPRPPRPSLPSNWDRYDDDELYGEREHEDVSVAVEHAKRGEGSSDVVLPKSKGADFGYLIEQARSQPRYREGSDLLFDDAVPEFLQGLGPFLSERGKSLLLSCGDDNFIVDDDATSSFEVPFLSLDLHALASQLSKLKPSERLFIDGELLPEELDFEDSNETNAEEFDYDKGLGEIDHDHDLTVSSHGARTAEIYHGSLQINEGHEIIPEKSTDLLPQPSISEEMEEHSMAISVFGLYKEEVTEMHKSSSDTLNTSCFECRDTSRSQVVTEAEAELDMLLDSLGDIKLSDSSSFNAALKESSIQIERPNLLAHTDLMPLRIDSGSSSHAIFDSTIEDYLAEAKPFTGSSSKEDGLRNTDHVGKLLMARDTALTTSHDQRVDDLFIETTAFPGGFPATSSTKVPSVSSTSLTKALDDLDSLLDGL